MTDPDHRITKALELIEEFRAINRQSPRLAVATVQLAAIKAILRGPYPDEVLPPSLRSVATDPRNRCEVCGGPIIGDHCETPA